MIAELDAVYELLMRADDAVGKAVAHVLPRIGVNVEKMIAESEAIVRDQLAAARAKSAEPPT